jgi:pyridoxine 4-dehydrogenase
VLEACLSRGIAFVPFAPLGFGASEVLNNPTVARVAARRGCTPAQARLAWELAFASNLLVIPGTSSRKHLRENLAAVQVSLDEGRRSALGTERRLTKGFLDAVPHGIELRCEGHLERVEDPL